MPEQPLELKFANNEHVILIEFKLIKYKVANGENTFRLLIAQDYFGEGAPTADCPFDKSVEQGEWIRVAFEDVQCLYALSRSLYQQAKKQRILEPREKPIFSAVVSIQRSENCSIHFESQTWNMKRIRGISTLESFNCF